MKHRCDLIEKSLSIECAHENSNISFHLDEINLIDLNDCDTGAIICDVVMVENIFKYKLIMTRRAISFHWLLKEIF